MLDVGELLYTLLALLTGWAVLLAERRAGAMVVMSVDGMVAM